MLVVFLGTTKVNVVPVSSSNQAQTNVCDGFGEQNERLRPLEEEVNAPTSLCPRPTPTEVTTKPELPFDAPF
jgi:hypothetical protein